MRPNDTHTWTLYPAITAEANEALQKYPRFMRQILFNRGISEPAAAHRYLEAVYVEESDPFQILGMSAAVQRIFEAIDSNQRIAVYGDYDVDGVTSTVLLVQVLRLLGGQVCEYIPHRIDEGYGLNIDALGQIHQEGSQLVISVDCGIRSIQEAEYAQAIGLDMIITDHHTCAAELPHAVAVINPRQPGDHYPEKELAGVGLAYKLAEALLSVRPVPGVRVEDWLDLVALGTVADLAALVGENRYLVRKGLDCIHRGRRQGLVSLAGVASLPIEKTTARDIGFILGPRLNAAGRLDTALLAYHLLDSDDVSETGRFAQQLDDQNRQRQELTRLVQARVEETMIALGEDTPLIFAADSDFQQGVLGLAASRIVETYYRPVIVAYRNAEYTRGSCRSIPDFHITEALDQCSDLLVRHGGHAAAAGFTVSNDHLDELMVRLRGLAAKKLGDLALLQKVVKADVELSLDELNYEMFDHLAKLQPTGLGNPEPRFVSRNLYVRIKSKVGKENQHLRILLSNGRLSYWGIAFGLGKAFEALSDRVDVLYTVEKNEFRGETSIQLKVSDIKPAS